MRCIQACASDRRAQWHRLGTGLHEGEASGLVACCTSLCLQRDAASTETEIVKVFMLQRASAVAANVSLMRLCLMQAEPAKWAGWVALGTDDVSVLVDEQLHDVADWEHNFKALKVRQMMTQVR